MAWASGMVGTITSIAAAMVSPRRRATSVPTSTPAIKPPGIPRPPCQRAGTSSQRPRNDRQSVATWYSRDPTRPAGIAHIEIEAMVSASPPRAAYRRWLQVTAANAPRAIISP